MPFKSKAQARLFYAAAAGRIKGGPSPSVAKQFIADTAHQPVGNLPPKVNHKIHKKRP